ncbi:hypothetical protein [Paenibacillus sp. FSL W7-1287]|uniref:hypothetical protein n=1 Tax=Paenibacillus sp. FSL W7-1287 TaxID=2954538 RepID=UPI0030F77657
MTMIWLTALIRRRIWGSTENYVALVPGDVRCATRFLVSPHLLGPESRDFEPLLEWVVQKYVFDDDV